MGFNFPASPAVGTLYPASITVGLPQYRWDGEKWKIYAGSTNSAGTFRRFEYNATAGQTTFSGADINGNVLAYTPNNIELFLNGTLLNVADYTASNGTSVILPALTLNDQVTVVAFTYGVITDAVLKAGDTMTGTLTAPGYVVTAANGGFVSTGINGFMEIGAPAIASTPFIDFHSSGNVNDFDARIVATGGLAAQGKADLAFYSATMSISGKFVAGTKGHLFGGSGGTSALGAVSLADANIILYTNSAVNWAGIGTDTSGNLWFRTGLSGTPIPAMYIDTNQKLNIQGDLAFTGSAWTSFATVLTAGSGAFGSASATMQYKIMGKTLFVRGIITITTVGTANIPILTLPVACLGGFVTGREVAVSGWALTGNISTSTTFLFTRYDGGTGSPSFANGQSIQYGGVFEIS